jgi:hypothetical protein
MHIPRLAPSPLLPTLACLSSLIGHIYAENTMCKSTPNEVSWPGISQWNYLNESLSGRLLHPSPPALPCHDIYPAPTKPATASYNARASKTLGLRSVSTKTIPLAQHGTIRTMTLVCQIQPSHAMVWDTLFTS